MDMTLRNYLLAVFKGCIITVDYPNKTPEQLAEKNHWLWQQEINYQDTDALVYAVNRYLFGQPFADFIDNSLSADNYDGDEDDAYGLDEILAEQDDDDSSDFLSEENYMYVINQRVDKLSNKLAKSKQISLSKIEDKMSSLTSYAEFDYVYDTHHVPSQKLLKIIAHFKPKVMDKIAEENTESDIKCFKYGGLVILIIIIIALVCAWYFIPTPHHTKSTPKPTVQRYLNNRYGTYHLPSHITKIIYNSKSQTLYLYLTKKSSKTYLKDSIDRQSYDENFDDIINNLNAKTKDNHSGCIIILKNGYHYIIKRNPKLQAIHNKHIAEQRRQENQQNRERNNNYHPVIFVPPATE